MTDSPPRLRRLFLAAAASWLLVACGRGEATAPAGAEGRAMGGVEAASHDPLWDAGGVLADDGAATAMVRAEAEALGTPAGGEASVVVDDPRDGSVFPPGMVPPTFLWHDETQADTWLVEIRFEDPGARPIHAVVPGAPPPQGEVDPEALGDTNEVYQPTPYQASARSWTPARAVWDEIQRRSTSAPAQVRWVGYRSDAPDQPLSRGAVGIQTSTDPVGAPIFYRDVPLMPGKGERGQIQPLGQNAIPRIAWRLRDITRPETRLVLTHMPSCGNCHSFSRDGKTFGMDVDGPQGDKGTYAIKAVSPQMRIDIDDVITWNSYANKPKGHKTIGFLSRVSPDGRYVITTLNEALYVSNFLDYRYLQVFYPTRGILAYYDRSNGEMKAVPGADDPEYVHTDGVWSPDGKWIVFARARAFDPYASGLPLATHPNDPNEPKIQYDLYRVPFRGGQPAGDAEPIRGASANGWSNTFPKVSPDGRWIVFTRCQNGQLMRPDGRLCIVPFEGGEVREMRCNTNSMNSWHSWSPNSRWLVFSSKVNTPYTQMFLTHVDADGNDTPAILVPGSTAANRAVNIPEFMNAPYDALQHIEVPAVEHQRYFWEATDLKREGKYADEIPLLEKAIAIEPDFTKAYLNLGEALSHVGRWDEAIQNYRRTLELDPKNVFAENNLGTAYMALQRPKDAIPHLFAALRLDPSLVGAMQNAGQALEQVGRLEESAAYYHKALAAKPDDPLSRWGLVTVYSRLQRAEDVKTQLQSLVAGAPDDVRALSMLAWLLSTSPDANIRDGARAVALAQHAVEVSKGARPEPFDALAAALAESGRYEDAAHAAEQGLRLIDGSTSPLVQGLQQRLALYRESHAYHAP